MSTALIARGTCRRIAGRWFDLTQYGDGRVVARQVLDMRPETQIPPPDDADQIPPPDEEPV